MKFSEAKREVLQLGQANPWDRGEEPHGEGPEESAKTQQELEHLCCEDGL